MSEGMNKVILLGNLGADPELRYTANGLPVLNFSMATNESWLDKNKERQERTEWHRVVVWGPRAEALSKFLAKGAGVLVEGGLRTSTFEKDGQRRYWTEVHARDILFTGRRGTAMGSDAGTEAARMERTSGGLAPPPPKGPEPLDELPF